MSTELDNSKALLHWLALTKFDEGNDCRMYHCKNVEEQETYLRYCNVVCFEDNRLLLNDNRFINASPIQFGSLSYIATQAPLPFTMCDFAKMIVDLDITLIITLGAHVERNVVKMEPYWSDEAEMSRRYVNPTLPQEMVTVTTTEVDMTKPWAERNLKFEYAAPKERVQMVKQLHFHKWPDYAAPESEPKITIDFIRRVDSFMEKNRPVVVHCSAGVGRTGMFIAGHIVSHLDKKQIPPALLKQAPGMDGDTHVEIAHTIAYNLVKYLKQRRTRMVGAISQYKFIIQLVHFYLFNEGALVSNEEA